jgi:hypothetical protein
MSINITVDGKTYNGIDTVTVGGKTIALSQQGQAVDPFASSTGKISLGHILHMCETASASGTLRLSAPVSGETEIVDTGLGSNLKYFLMFDDDTTAFFTSVGEGVVFFFADVTNACIRALTNSSTAVITDDNSGRLSTRFSSGKLYFTPRIANNDGYTPFVSGRNYKWFAW